ncbi:hypothetical protein Pfo_020261, partial [Paulownia fortunei]
LDTALSLYIDHHARFSELNVLSLQNSMIKVFVDCIIWERTIVFGKELGCGLISRDYVESFVGKVSFIVA